MGGLWDTFSEESQGPQLPLLKYFQQATLEENKALPNINNGAMHKHISCAWVCMCPTKITGTQGIFTFFIQTYSIVANVISGHCSR